MKKSLLGILIMLLTASIGYSQTADVEKMIMEKEKEMYEAIKSGNMEPFKANLADNFVSVYESGIANRSQELQNIQNVKIDSYELSDFRVLQPTDDVAIAVYKMKGSGSYMGEKFDSEYYCSSTWKKTDGTWQAVLHTEVEASDEMGEDGMAENDDY